MPHPSTSNHPLRIVPKELIFPPPLNRVITNILKLNNVSQFPIAYKVKTTAPQRYCVRPNNGILPPGETIEVQVLLNYIKDAPPNLDIKDKFQIQSIILNGQYNPNDISDIWAKAPNDQIYKQKLKARFTATSSSSSSVKPHPSSLQGPPASTSSNVPQLHPTQPTPTPQQPPSTQPTNTIEEPADTAPPKISAAPSLAPLDSQRQAQYFTPRVQTNLQDKSKVAEISLAQAHFEIHQPTPLPTNVPLTEPRREPEPDFTPGEPLKQTGDYVVDTVANISSLRKALEQVSTLKSEKENVLRENQRLAEQIKTLVELQRSKDESGQTGLRHRTPNAPTPTPPSTRTDQTSMEIQIQTKVFLIVILIFAVVGFLLGRFSR